jgi:hypothetical protein
MSLDSNEQLNISEFKEALDLLDAVREGVQRGEIMSVMVICEKTDGDLCGGNTATQNQFTVAGYMLTWALRRLGFTQFQDVRKMT